MSRHTAADRRPSPSRPSLSHRSPNRPSGPRPDPQPRPEAPPLVVCDDDQLLAELLPLAAAADVVPTVVPDAASALSGWSRAPVVLVGADQAAALAALLPEARRRTYLVARGRASDDLFRAAVRLGADDVVELPQSAGWLVEQLADLTERLPGRARVIGVIGGAGGAGATTLACALAQRAARRGPTAIIDCDPQGPGLDRMFGLERTDGFRWDALCQSTGRLSARALREALPRRGGLGVLSWYVGSEPQSLQAFAARSALSAARRGHHVVVLDLPRSTDPLIDELAARCDELLIPTPATVLGVAAAARIRARFADHPGATLLLRGEDLDADEVSRAVGLPVLAQMRDQRGLAETLDLGLGPLPDRHRSRGPLARVVASILGDPVGDDESGTAA